MTVSGAGGQDWVTVWIEGQRAAVEKWLSAQKTPAAVEQAAAFGGLFQQLAGAAPGMPDFGKQIAAMWGSFPPAPHAVASLPGLGPLREQQEIWQGLVNALSDYQRLSGEMAKVMAKVHSDTLDLLARRSLEQANAGQPVTGSRALHDLWIECGEATYARVAQGDAYCRLQADLCNAGVRVQSHQQQLLERWLKQLDLPTRSELNTLHHRVQELKKRLDAMTASQEEPSRRKSSVSNASPHDAGESVPSRPRKARKKS